MADIVNGSVVRSYVTPMLDQNVSMTVNDGVDNPVYYYNQDERQSVMNLTDDTGVIAQSYGYSAYGDKLRSQVSSLIPNRYTYTGRELSDTTGDFYFRYRTYSAGTGSFMQRDPLGFVDGPSVYLGYFSQALRRDPMGTVAFTLEDKWEEFEVEVPAKVNGGSAGDRDVWDFDCGCEPCKGKIDTSKLTCKFILKKGIKMQFKKGDWSSGDDSTGWYGWAKNTTLRIGVAYLHRAIKQAWWRDDDRSRREIANEVYDLVLKHEKAHINYWKAWHDSRFAVTKAIHGTEYGPLNGESGSVRCEKEKTRFKKEMEADKFYFGLWQYVKIHKENTNSPMAPNYPLISVDGDSSNDGTWDAGK